MNELPLKVLLFISFTSFFVLSCIDSATDMESGPAVIQGRVDGVSSSQDVQSVEGAVVTANRVSSTGDLETIGDTEAETDENGAFTLDITEEAWAEVETGSRIVLTAESEEGIGKTFVTSEIISGIIVQAKPVTVESTAEANVLEQIVADGEEGNVQNADIELAVSTEITSGLDSNPSVASDVATVLAEQAEVRTVFYDRQGIEPDNEEINRLKNDAQVELENRLYDLGDSQEERQAAYSVFMESMANVEMDAGVEAFQAAVASELASRMILNADNGLSDDLIAEMYRINSYKTASALDNSVQNQLELVNAGNNAINIAEDAGEVMQSEILTNVNASIEEIKAIFSTYSEQVVTAVESNDTEDSDVFVTINNLIGGESGAKAVFESALENASEPDQVVEVYTQFSSSVRSDVSSGFDELEGDTADAYANLMILLNIAS